MRILLIYPFQNQRNLITNFIAHLREKNIKIDFICYADFAYSKSNDSKWPWWILLCCNVIEKARGSFIGRCIRSAVSHLLRDAIFYNLLCTYDLIDFHAYYAASYNKYIKYCISNQIRFDITNWGSDVMRATKESISEQKIGYENCRFIKIAENLQLELNRKSDYIYQSKMRTAYFGNSDFSFIDAVTVSSLYDTKKKLFGETGEKLVVTCGYNGSHHQNHIEIIQSLNQIKTQVRDKIHLVFPLTYGAETEYIQSIRDNLDNINITYTILDSFLTYNEMAVLRKASNIVINIQDTDALAGSLMDHLYCGNVCIFGEWLNYIPYDKNNVFYIKSSKTELSDKIIDAIQNYNTYAEKCKKNHDILYSLFSWNFIIDNWIKIYGE